MGTIQPSVELSVIPFPSPKRRESARPQLCLNSRDRFEISEWRVRAGLAGFNRLVIHDRDETDGSDVGDFLTAYRQGESWSCWGFARRGPVINAWCCQTWQDAGTFDSINEAFLAILGSMSPPSNASPRSVDLSGGPPAGATVIDLAPRLRSCAQPLGSAA